MTLFKNEYKIIIQFPNMNIFVYKKIIEKHKQTVLDNKVVVAKRA